MDFTQIRYEVADDVLTITLESAGAAERVDGGDAG